GAGGDHQPHGPLGIGIRILLPLALSDQEGAQRRRVLLPQDGVEPLAKRLIGDLVVAHVRASLVGGDDIPTSPLRRPYVAPTSPLCGTTQVPLLYSPHILAASSVRRR